MITLSRSRRRAAKYIALAVLTTASASIAAVDFHDWRQVVAFVGAQIVSGCVAGKAYHDTTASKVPKQP